MPGLVVFKGMVVIMGLSDDAAAGLPTKSLTVTLLALTVAALTGIFLTDVVVIDR